MKAIIRRPQSVFLRKALFQVHLWTGVLAGLYVLVVCATGAALVFRIDLQRALHPELFTPSTGAPADAATVLERVTEAFPRHRVSGIDAPTTARPTYLAYVVDERRFLTLLFDPATARLLGELPERSVVRTIQDLHFDLLAGRAGRVANGVGGALLLTLCVSGLVIWWPGIADWRRGFTVDFRRNWKRVNRELHSVVGICAVAFVAMWAITGVYFAFPSQLRAVVNAISPLTRAGRPPSSGVKPVAGVRVPSWRDLIDLAQKRMPDQHIARVVLPASDRAAFLVMFSPVAPYPAGRSELTSVYLDQYTGAVLPAPAAGTKTFGDIAIEWVLPLHAGNFGGTPIRIAWLVLGLSPPLLFVTGFIMWWTRVVRPRWILARRAAQEAAG